MAEAEMTVKFVREWKEGNELYWEFQFESDLFRSWNPSWGYARGNYSTNVWGTYSGVGSFKNSDLNSGRVDPTTYKLSIHGGNADNPYQSTKFVFVLQGSGNVSGGVATRTG